jgi:ribosomal protein S18 acetylase RimI-like enzyme
VLATDQPPIAAALAAARSMAPPGVAIRAWRDEDDYRAMVDVFHRARVVDGTNWDLSVEAIAADVRAFGSRPEESILIATVDGAAIGWTRYWDFGRSPDEGRLLMHSGHVDPADRGRGVGCALQAGAQAGLAIVRAATPDPAGTTAGIHCWLFSGNASAIALLEEGGYRRLRYVVEMTRPLADVPTTDLPAGLTTRPVRPEDCLEIARAMDAAMHDHRGWPEWTESQLLEMLDHPTRGQHDVWQVAWDGDRVVGGVLGYIDEQENAVMGRRRGYTEGIFTVRDWRGRGVAGALIARNLRLLRDRGMEEAALSVDTENPTGALDLYQRHGFREQDRLIIFRKDLEAAV